LFAIWYFLLILPQQKKDKKRQEMLKALKKGDRVITVGGIHGVVEKADEQLVTLKIGGILVDFSRSAVASVGGLQEANQEKKG
jgi:preprotein translocase subunit YajC